MNTKERRVLDQYAKINNFNILSIKPGDKGKGKYYIWFETGDKKLQFGMYYRPTAETLKFIA